MGEDRTHVLLSAAISLDGYLDDASDRRLLLSNERDMAAVRQLRSTYDAVVVGGRTVRRDNPSLLATGQSQPAKIVISESADLDPQSRFFTTGDSEKIILCGRAARARISERFERAASAIVFDGFDQLGRCLAELRKAKGIRRVMVEGGGTVLTEFLTRGLADELRLAIAPFFVGDVAAPRFVNPGAFGHDKRHRAELVDTAQLHDMAVLRYRLTR